MAMSRRRLLKALSLSPLALSPLIIAPLTMTWRTASASSMQTAPLVIHGEQGPTRFDVEIADEPQERNFGLMERESIPLDHGMLFLYDAPRGVENGFWMYRTLIPLDIAFIGADGRIVDIQQMQPCKGEAPSCPATQPAQAYHAALEVNAGVLEKLGVRVGDCVSWPGSNGQCG